MSRCTGRSAVIDETQVRRWLAAPSETEHLEFKSAKNQFDSKELTRYCAAMANEGGGHLLLGVSDARPRRVIGSSAFSGAHLSSMKLKLLEAIHLRIDTTELLVEGERVVVFTIPSRFPGIPIAYEGAYWMRSGESLMPMTAARLKEIFNESAPDWSTQAATGVVSDEDVISTLDTQGFFDLCGIPYASERSGVLARLEAEGAIAPENGGWVITNLGALTLSKSLSSMSEEMSRRAPRIVIYDGVGKLNVRDDEIWDRGLAVGFEELLRRVDSAAPQNRLIEQALRTSVQMFPLQALRELIANAFIHQDLTTSGMRVMIEMYDDRVEISNPGIPLCDVERFIDEYKSRNERLTDLMRRLRICEERGSGIDKVVAAAETHMLPAPEFRTGNLRTSAILFGHREFSQMTREDRIRACYQHCCLLYVTSRTMTNSSLRERFGLRDNQAAIATTIIGNTKDEGLIVQQQTDSNSQRYARYVPSWA
jgi:ATP-dependent DNA helicase RecG